MARSVTLNKLFTVSEALINDDLQKNPNREATATNNYSYVALVLGRIS